jgi:hypothetical protein
MPVPRWTVAIAAVVAVLAAASARADAAPPQCEEARRNIQSALESACPCDAADDHAYYVRCVARKLRELSACRTAPDGARVCGPVPRECVAKLRKTASGSACGERGAVTCCLPKQRDCVGDRAPGDGTAAGVCSGTTRACDRVTDCVVSTCRLSNTEERCRIAGGTIGNGKDCATACAP